MGEVWRARDTKLGRDIAIKTLPEEFARDANRLARFEREAKLLASLNHPNIATIYGLEEDTGTRFLVLELVEGPTLADQIKRGALPEQQSLKLALQIAEALEAAHEKGVIHRDLKPANIKLTPEGTVKVLDFGLAKALGGNGETDLSDLPTLSLAATQEGMILGTPTYMSPEQLRGRPADKQIDIWAFGCVLFELLTGRKAFGQATLNETMAKVLEGDFDRAALPRVSPLVRRLVDRCLEKAPRDRLRHIGDARIDIRDALAELSLESTPEAPGRVVSSARQTFMWAGGVGVFIVLAAIAGSFLTLRAPPEPPAVITRLSIGPVQEPGTGPSGSLDVAVSSDGTRIAFQSGDQIWLKAMDQVNAVPIATGSNPFFSPDGERLAFVGGGLNTISVNGGATVEIVPLSGTGAGGRFAGGTWGDDGTIAFATSLGLSLVSENGGDPQTLISAPEGRVYAWPHFMPDGQSLLFTVLAGPSTDTAEIALLDLQTMTTRIVHQGGVGARYVSAGYLVYLTGQGLAAVGFDPDTGRVRGASRQIPDIELQPGGAYLAADFAISETGILAHIPAGPAFQNWLVWVDHSGTEEFLSGLPSGRISYPRVSPQGTAWLSISPLKEARTGGFGCSTSNGAWPRRSAAAFQSREPLRTCCRSGA